MTPFLKQVARHYCADGNNGGISLERRIFVLPGHRAVVFFRKYLSECIKESGSSPMIAPQMLSVEEFFSTLSGGNCADKLTLILHLYDCYSELCAEDGIKCESLDEFLFWGEVILNDFNDVDKYLINARDIFRNVSDLKDLSDDLSYLTENQEKAIRAFLGHFEKTGEYKIRFARLWNLLGRLYEAFNERLDKEGLFYEGRLYRTLAAEVSSAGAEDMLSHAFPDACSIVFCGLNVLCECEKKILHGLKNAGLAEFCWDFNNDWIRDTHNKSSLFLSENILSFGNAFEQDACTEHPEIEVISVPSGVGQTKLLSSLLSAPDVPVDERTAIVLPDETLLQPMLNSIPSEVEKVNVTMGFSMAGSSFYSLMSDIAHLQLRLRRKEDGFYFYHRFFSDIVNNNVFAALLDERGKEIVNNVRKARNYYISEDVFKGSGLLELVFVPAVTDLSSNESSQIYAIENYQLGILEYIGRKIASDERLKTEFSLELDFAMEYVKSINLLSSKELKILPATYFSLLDGSLKSKSVPIKGEPLTGLQIMGPLETRALDFERLFILSCNDGVFPRTEVGASFIPPLLRRGFGLPGYEYQDAVWAYYFYRMIQRPSKVTLLLDSRTEGLRSGEESRYVKQLQYHFGASIKRSSANSNPSYVSDDGCVKKTREHLDIIHSKELSPTSLKTYLACSLQFYYSFVLGLKAEEQVEENMDAGIIGNVYHHVMEKLYSGRPDGIITRQYLMGLLSDETGLKEKVYAEAEKEMHCDTITGRDIVFCTMICKYVSRTIECDLGFMDRGKVDSFRVLALERTYHGTFGAFRFKGTVDRLDSFAPGTVRLVDYKTGKVLDEDTEISDSNAVRLAEKIFSPNTKDGDRPKIALQFFLYDMILGQQGVTEDSIVSNAVYSTRSILSEMPVNVVKNNSFCAEMENQLQGCLDEIDNLEVPFRRKKEEFEDKTCEWCDFKNICGR